VDTRRFFVVDRGQGFKAVMNEQNLEHGNHLSRFGDPERYARLGKLYGVGGIVVASIQCGARHRALFGDSMRCVQYLALVNANTAEVVAAVQYDQSDVDHYYTEVTMAPSWDEAVDKFMDAIPKEFERELYDNNMKHYRREIAEESQREKEGAK